LQKKVIIHPMGFYEPWSLSQNKIKKFIAWNLYQKNLLLKADLIHCASKIEEKNLKKLNKKFKTIVLPFGINNKFIKKKNNIKINKKALFFSRLHKKKGLDILIRAWLSVGNNDWSLDIVGPGDYKKYINKVASTKKNIKINFIKPVYKHHQKIELFNKYDFLVLPTENENFGLVILESIARGVPVLTTNRCPWESLQKYNAGWVINFSYLELKLVLNKIFQMTKKEFFLKKKNSTKLASKFALEKLFNKYIAVYNKFI
jgi:glycosyltransferase involved in cell wall biosynthesis